ncbi:hypothetical protein B296_00018780 [Ensete ventricosum]|uniref:Uncharacterized protein n=1 Tax=Ensete ventricosum TaxID=4639 RepID=A0A426YN60_ENSVE|nr:hypothetical protein B296_00018780 [Ensete ventricosum]
MFFRDPNLLHDNLICMGNKFFVLFFAAHVMHPLRFPNSGIRAKATRKGVAGHGQGPLQRGCRLRPGQLARAVNHGQPAARLWLPCDRSEGGQQPMTRLERQPPTWAMPAGTTPVRRPPAGRSFRLQGRPFTGMPVGATPMEVLPVGAASTTKAVAPAP